MIQPHFIFLCSLRIDVGIRCAIVNKCGKNRLVSVVSIDKIVKHYISRSGKI